MMMFGIDSNESTNKQHYFSTFGVFLLILYFGATLTSLGKIFDLIGGFSTIVLGKACNVFQEKDVLSANFFT